MKKYSLLVFFACLFATGYGQVYHIDKEITTNDFIKPGDNLNGICYKIYNDTLFQLRIVNKDTAKYDLKITLFDLQSGTLLGCDTLGGLPLSFGEVEDFLIMKGKIVLTTSNQFVCFERKNMAGSLYLYPEGLIYKKDTVKFNYCELLNDSLVLLYTVYNYHPLDGMAGCHLRTFNIHTHRFVQYKFVPFPGIGISHITGNWVAVVKNKIYVTAPLTGVIRVYDCKLNLLHTTGVAVFEKTELSENTRYQTYIDSVIDNEAVRIRKIANKYPKDSIKYHQAEYSSEIHAKRFIANTVQEVRGKHKFINNISAVDDSIIALYVSQPGYAGKYRDVYFYHPLKDKIVKKYLHMRCVPADTLTKPEDFYTIRFSGSKPFLPCLYKGYAYSATLYPLSSYRSGKYDDLALSLLNATKNTGYKWTVIKYRID